MQHRTGKVQQTKGSDPLALCVDVLEQLISFLTSKYVLVHVMANVQIEGLAATKRERSPESSKNRRP
jgi:hypothetical protein